MSQGICKLLPYLEASVWWTESYPDTDLLGANQANPWICMLRNEGQWHLGKYRYGESWRGGWGGDTEVRVEACLWQSCSALCRAQRLLTQVPGKYLFPSVPQIPDFFFLLKAFLIYIINLLCKRKPTKQNKASHTTKEAVQGLERWFSGYWLSFQRT